MSPGVMAQAKQDVTRLLEAWNLGDPQALDQLMPLVVDELRSIARALFVREDRANTLQPTALVNELFLRFVGRRSVHWKNRRHFFRVAAQIMRRLLVDHARHRHAAKRGGDAARLPFAEEIPLAFHGTPEDILALNDLLDRLAELGSPGRLRWWSSSASSVSRSRRSPTPWA
jgi:RNA polymerase sigma factor (TIGR02999 family)